MNFPRLFPFFLLLLLLAFLPQLDAQVGNNNPTGVSGIFNGNVTTGCSYDPYTGNAHRAITDIVVAGAVGEYPLALTRTSNSRDAQGTAFGQPGAWRHNYQWLLLNSAPVRTTGSPPTHYEPPSYTVKFPDGRIETFTDTGGSDPNFRTTAGVRDRFQPLTPLTNLCYLLLPDGGKVEFKATFMSEYQPGDNSYLYWNEYVAQAIIDPYGLRTTFTYDTNSPPRLSKVTEPAGRYLQFTYRTDNTIDKVTASDGRIVDYTYTTAAFPPSGTTTYTALTSVTYYGTWTARYTYRSPNINPATGVPLLWTADDPMYSGPMKRIAYEYKFGNNPDLTAAVYGQIYRERYWDGVAGHEATGAAVSALEITDSTHRKETRGDNKIRTFIYTITGYVTWVSDFMTPAHQSSQTYDANKYVYQVTNFNRVPSTDFIHNALNGNVTMIVFPLTPGDTPNQTGNPTIQYTYGWAGCADSYNYDWSNPYYVCTARDEATHVTQFWRDPNSMRVTKIDYPDGGYETFTYNSFGQVLSHRMTTGGIESFTYDTRGLKLTYRNPSNATGNPTARYQYDAYDRVSGVTDALGLTSGDVNHTTSFEYNLRGQLTKTTLPTDPPGGGRPTIVKMYNTNGDGTLVSVTDQLSHTTSYTYDDYRRLKSVTTPARYTGDSTHTTNLFYDATGAGDDYKYADSKVTYVTLPSGKQIKASYDDNRRKISVTTGFNTADPATTGYTYDNVGNLTKVTKPLTTHTITTVYDERNRPWKITDANNYVTEFEYDPWGRKLSVTRPNGQVTAFNSYDAMNRLLQQTVKQTPGPDAVTKYTYTPAGLVATMQDPRLVAINSPDKYTYTYDTTGRKAWVIYPPDSGGVSRGEQFIFDTAGRLESFKNRAGNVQTFTYDALNRMIRADWSDSTPDVTFGYDIGSRLITINNANATISRTYFNDNLLNSETETITGGVARTLSYTYDADGNRASLQFPGYSFTYDYTGRNQLKNIMSGATTLVTFGYDLDGNLSSRTVDNSTYTDYGYDALDRVTSVTHALNGTTRTFAYDYDNVGNRKWTKRDGGTGDVFGYDYADQVTAVKLDIPNPDTTSVGSQTIVYDANGNRTSFSPYGTTDYYTINNLNQYTSRGDTPPPTTPTPSPTSTPTPTPTPTPPPTATPTPTPGRAAEPTFSPDGGVFFITQARTVTVATTTTGADMHYTINGPPPTSTTGTHINGGSSGTVSVTPSLQGTILQVIAYKSGMTDSIVHSATFYYEDEGPEAPATSASYDFNGNLTIGLDGSTYTYDAQNRLLTASRDGVTYTFKYDGLNRQVSRTVGGVTTYSVWDGWDLVEEYQGAGTVTAAYLYGPTGLVKNLVSNNYYYQDGSGSTSHIANSSGALVEWYRYDLHGTPIIYDSNDNLLPASAFGIRHLFTGQQWYRQLGLYDLRNRFYSPDIGRFLPPDPIGFAGDPTNLYRYVRNNPLKWSDPSGLVDDSEGWSKWTLKTEEIWSTNAVWSADRVWVFGNGFPSALEHALGGEGLLENSPHSGRADGVGSAGDGAGGGAGANGTEKPGLLNNTSDPTAPPPQNPEPPSQNPPTPSPSPPGISPQTMMNIGAGTMAGGGVIAIAGGVMTFIPGLQGPGLILGGIGVGIIVPGGLLFTMGYITAEAGAEGY